MEKQFVDEFGLSRSNSIRRIADAYKTSTSTVYAYLTYGGSQKNPTSSKYVDQKDHPNYSHRHLLYDRFRYDPARFIAPLYRDLEEAISLSEISMRLNDSHQYLPRISTLQKLADYGSPRTGDPILDRVVGSEKPPLYKLAMSGYDRHHLLR